MFEKVLESKNSWNWDAKNHQTIMRFFIQRKNVLHYLLHFVGPKWSNFNTLFLKGKTCYNTFYTCPNPSPTSCPNPNSFSCPNPNPIFCPNPSAFLKEKHNTFYIFWGPKSSNYNTLLFQKKMFHESCCFFLVRKVVRL